MRDAFTAFVGADEMSLLDATRWADEAELAIGCLSAVPAGEP